MRRALVPLSILCLAWAGCQAPTKDRSVVEEGRPRQPPSVQVAPRSQGKIVQIRPELRYVVVDFQLSVPPRPGTVLGVYRGGKPVGAIQLSTQAEQNIFAADMLDGTLLVGDEVY